MKSLHQWFPDFCFGFGVFFEVVVVVNCFGIVKIQALRKPPKLQIQLQSLFINRDNIFSQKNNVEGPEGHKSQDKGQFLKVTNSQKKSN